VTTPEPGRSDAGDEEPAKPDLRKDTDPLPSVPDQYGSTTGSPGPGWETQTGVGTGPGWGSSPTYPTPTSQYPDNAGYPEPTPGYPESTPGSGPVYGTPDPQYPMSGAPGQTGAGYPGEAYPSAGYPGATYQAPPQAGYGPAPQPTYGAYTAPPGYPQGAGYDVTAPYGRDPYTGEPYSDKSKVTAGILEILLGAFGAGRFYLDQPGIAIAQIAVTWLTCGIGGIWPLIDGILMLTGKVRDNNGRPLRP